MFYRCQPTSPYPIMQNKKFVQVVIWVVVISMVVALIITSVAVLF